MYQAMRLLELLAGELDPLADLARALRGAVAQASSSGTSAAMKTVTLPGTSSCTRSAPSSSSSRTQTFPSSAIRSISERKRPVAAPGDVRHLEELPGVHAARELVVGGRQLATVDLPGRCGRVVAEIATSNPSTRSSRPLISVPLPAPDGPVTTKTATATRPQAYVRERTRPASLTTGG